jgi:hypothetical protein
VPVAEKKTLTEALKDEAIMHQCSGATATFKLIGRDHTLPSTYVQWFSPVEDSQIHFG